MTTVSHYSNIMINLNNCVVGLIFIEGFRAPDFPFWIIDDFGHKA